MRRVLTLWLVVAALAACGDAPEETDASAGPLDDPVYAFCHDTDAEVVLTASEAETWCPLLDEAPEDACPGLRAACAEDAVEDTDVPSVAPGGCTGASGDRGGGEGSQQPRAPEAPLEVPEPSDMAVTAGEVVGQVLRWTVAFLVAALVVGLLFLVVRLVIRMIRRGRVQSEPLPAPVQVSESVEVPDADALPDAPAADLLAGARTALSEGRFADVVLLSRGVALRALGEAGVLRLHASRTDREYVRSMSRKDERRGALRLVLRSVEQLRWGGRPVTEEDARSALDAAARLVPLVLLALGLVLVPADARAQSDHGLDGSAALQRVFSEAGFDVRWRLRTLRTVDEADVLVVDTFEVALSAEDGAALRSWVAGGGVLLLAGTHDAFPEVGTYAEGPVDDLRIHTSVRAAGLSLPAALGGGVYGLQDSHGTPWVTGTTAEGETGVVVQIVPIGEGCLIGLSDPRYLQNGALVAPRNVAFLAGLPRVGVELGLWGLSETPRLELATIGGASVGGGEDGSSVENPLASMANARLLALVLQILLILVLVALWRGWPFGPLRDPPSEGRIRFSDHAVALGRRFRRTGSSRHAAAMQCDLWLRRMGPVALQAAAERHGYGPAEAAELVARARELAEHPEGPNAASDFVLVEELWRITTTSPEA